MCYSPERFRPVSSIIFFIYDGINCPTTTMKEAGGGGGGRFPGAPLLDPPLVTANKFCQSLGPSLLSRIVFIYFTIITGLKKIVRYT